MKCPFCPIHSEDSRLLAIHLRHVHGQTSPIEYRAPGRALLALPVSWVDIDAIHSKYVLCGGRSFLKASVGV